MTQSSKIESSRVSKVLGKYYLVLVYAYRSDFVFFVGKILTLSTVRKHRTHISILLRKYKKSKCAAFSYDVIDVWFSTYRLCYEKIKTSNQKAGISYVLLFNARPHML